MKFFLVPRNVGDKLEVSGFSIDQIIVVTIGAVTGFLSGYLLYTLPLGIMAAALFGRIGRKYPDGYLVHAAYWYGIFNIKGMVANFKRNFYS